MNFNEAINIISSVLNLTGTTISVDNYDGIIVKRLESSNTLDEGRSTNQTHIAITGGQMDIFPYLRSDGYFNDQESDPDLKKYFITQIPLTLCESNVKYLAGDNTDVDIYFSEGKKRSHTSVVRGKRRNQADQIQVSLINFDGSDFVSFRRLLHAGSFIIVLKKKQLFDYDIFGVIPNRGIDGDAGLQDLNNQFFKLPTNSTVNVIEMQAIESVDNLNTPNEAIRVRGGTNVLLYGVPGCGKSYTIKTKYCKDADDIERVVFHPDYTYGDFVGQILPMTDEVSGKIKYEFSPGPFTRILSAAYNNPDKKYCLVIEEINRGNAPAIFGDIFQLLDREEDGSGSYDITNLDVADKVYIYNKSDIAEPNKIKIPSNLYIFATMNTSDQNVFTLDTAFQRRWSMRMIENDVSKSKIAGHKILDTNIKWAVFNKTINELVLSKNVGMTSSEDKRLGAYFVTEKDLHFFTTNDGISQEEADDRNQNFPEKVLKYLWDDAFKFTRDEVFKSEYDSLEKLIKAFETAEGDKRFNIFLDDIFVLNQDE